MMARGPVRIHGVTTRVSTSEDRSCAACSKRIHTETEYERVARLGGKIESYHPPCFADEFGEREAYGA